MSYTGFSKLQSKIASQPGMNAAQAGAIAAMAGREKYGAKAMAKGAAAGTSLRGKPVKKGKHHNAIAKYMAAHRG